MDANKIEDVKKEFKRDVCDKGGRIDPHNEHDWYSLSIGYFLAKGLSIDEAVTLARDVRYHEQYWQK